MMECRVEEREKRKKKGIVEKKRFFFSSTEETQKGVKNLKIKRYQKTHPLYFVFIL
jgi:hypothetical protein